jgi:hypothetical protein
MRFPLAWYITWTTYGTWLHGDPRGSHLGVVFIPADAVLEAAMRAQMTEDALYLTYLQRSIVDAAVVAECAAQEWILHQRNVRTNHVHVVVSAAMDGEKVRSRLKAIASDALSTDAGLPMGGKNGRRRWWTEKGNVVPVETERSLEEIGTYVRDLQ